MNTNPIVIALGGNALDCGESFMDYPELKPACEAMAQFASKGLIITHGNGPQIGALAEQAKGGEQRPLDVLNAETEGLLGYLIEQELANNLPSTPVSTLLTRVEVANDDPAFQHASKPVGRWLRANEKQNLAEQYNWEFIEDEGHFRRVVPSPKPQRTLQLEAINKLLQAGQVVVCAGGGGIPVRRTAAGEMQGIEAVIDKDFSSALIARELNARLLVLATRADGVYKNWQTPEQSKIASADPRALDFLSLAEGSMGPKVAAACDFVRATRSPAVIGALKDLPALLQRRAGTVIQWQEDI